MGTVRGKQHTPYRASCLYFEEHNVVGVLSDIIQIIPRIRRLTSIRPLLNAIRLVLVTREDFTYFVNVYDFA